LFFGERNDEFMLRGERKGGCDLLFCFRCKRQEFLHSALPIQKGGQAETIPEGEERKGRGRSSSPSTISEGRGGKNAAPWTFRGKELVIVPPEGKRGRGRKVELLK